MYEEDFVDCLFRRSNLNIQNLSVMKKNQ